jgi:hypothetical protein
MKLQLLILLTLIHGMVFSQTKKIAHKSHSGSATAYAYLLNHNLLEIDNCGEGLAFVEQDRIIKFDTVKVIAPNHVVVYSYDEFHIKIIDTNYVPNIEANEPLPMLKRKMRDNYGNSFTEETIIIKEEKQAGKWKDERMIPEQLGGRSLENFDYSLISEDTVRILSLTNTTDIPINFHVYLNSKIINYHINLKPNESKKIIIQLFQGIENRLCFYLLSDDKTCRKMIYGSLKVTDNISKVFVDTKFDLGYVSTLILKNGAIKKGSSPILPFTKKNDFGTKMRWLISISLISLLITLLFTVIRSRTKWVFQS